MASKNEPIVLHVNQLTIRSNNKSGKREPPLIVRGKTSKVEPVYASEITLHADGKEIGKLVYSPDKPLSCGARVWLELDSALVSVSVKES